MGVMIQGGGGNPTVWFQPVSLTGLYLRAAFKATQNTLAISETMEQIEERLEKTVMTILWSSLALESGANEFAENILPVNELVNFDNCRKIYKKPDSISRTIWKWSWLFKLGPKVEIPISEAYFVKAEELIQIRHRLAHYKPQDTARKLYFDVPPPAKKSDGNYHGVMWSADMIPSKVEPSLVESALLKKPSSEYYMAARGVFSQWELKNGRDTSEIDKIFPNIS